MNLTGGDVNANLTYTVGNFKYHFIDPVDMGPFALLCSAFES
jgi:hypothetical protein